MRVYLLGIYEIECDPVIGIYSTRAKAQGALLAYKVQHPWDDLHIDEYELDDEVTFNPKVLHFAVG